MEKSWYVGIIEKGEGQRRRPNRIHEGNCNDDRCGISRKSRDTADKAAPGVRAAKSSEPREGQ